MTTSDSLQSLQSAGERKKQLADSLIRKLNKQFNAGINNGKMSHVSCDRDRMTIVYSSGGECDCFRSRQCSL